MRLYTRWMNSAGERVRIALNLKNISYEYVPINSLPEGEYLRINPQGLMPAMEVDGQVFAQSGAILAFIEERFPARTLLPEDSVLRAQARSFGALIAGEMHALTVHRVRGFLESDIGANDAAVEQWMRHWLTLGFGALEQALAARAEAWPYCFGETPGWADLHLIPQMASARRRDFDLSPYPLLQAIEARCVELDAFARARPEAQPDFPG